MKISRKKRKASLQNTGKYQNYLLRTSRICKEEKVDQQEEDKIYLNTPSMVWEYQQIGRNTKKSNRQKVQVSIVNLMIQGIMRIMNLVIQIIVIKVNMKKMRKKSCSLLWEKNIEKKINKQKKSLSSETRETIKRLFPNKKKELKFEGKIKIEEISEEREDILINYR